MKFEIWIYGIKQICTYSLLQPSYKFIDVINVAPLIKMDLFCMIIHILHTDQTEQMNHKMVNYQSNVSRLFFLLFVNKFCKLFRSVSL